MRVAILSYNAQSSDALGNQVAEKLAFFLDRGADTRVFLETDQRVHAAVRPHCRVVTGPKPQADCWEFLSSADLIIVDYGQYYRLLELLPCLAAGTARLLFDYHGVTPAEFWEAQNREALAKGVHRRGLVWCCDAALVHSDFSRRELREQTAFPTDRISLIDYPVDTSHFCPGSPRRHLAAQLGLHDASLLLFVGRLAPNKRLPVLVEALARLRDRTPPIHIVLVGDMTDVYQAEASRCRKRAAELRLAERIHFLGQVSDAQLRDAYRSADLFVMPSRHEGFCIPVVEAMACGLPVVAAQAGALPETVADAGLTFTADDPDDLARQVQRVLERPGRSLDRADGRSESLAERLRRQGLRRAAAHDRSLWRARFGQVVEELRARPPRQRRDQLEVWPRTPQRAVAAGSKSMLVPVRIVNRGTQAALSEGPGSVVLRSLVTDELGRPCLPALDTPLPKLLVPGEEALARMRVPVPTAAGTYQVALFAALPPSRFGLAGCPHQPGALARDGEGAAPGVAAADGPTLGRAHSSFRLLVTAGTAAADDHSWTAVLQSVHQALAEAAAQEQLPIDYLDVSHGFLAKCKRWIKRKLLGNFKEAYVDVLSRQQSLFNRLVLTALQELAECCGFLEQALAGGVSGGCRQRNRQSRPLAGGAMLSRAAAMERDLKAGNPAERASLLHELAEQLAAVRRRFAVLEARLHALEARESVEKSEEASLQG